MFIYALEMRYRVTIRSLSAHTEKKTHTHSSFHSLLPLVLVYHLIVLEYVHIFLMWWVSGLYIIHNMLVLSGCDVSYEYCAAGSGVFVILIRQGAFFSYFFTLRIQPEQKKVS